MKKPSQKKNNKPRKATYPVRRSELEFDSMGQDYWDLKDISRDTSYWAIDDSGTPKNSEKSSEYLTLTAITTLSDTDLYQLFSGITRYDGEIKFNLLRLNNEDQCLSVMRRLGQSNVLILCYPKYKNPETLYEPTKFFMDSVQRLIDGILTIDKSALVVISIDENNFLKPEDYYRLCSSRCIVYPTSSKDSLLAQTADLSASSLGHGLLPINKGNRKYFDQILGKSVNVHGKPGECTQQTPSGFTRDNISSATKDKKISKNQKKTGIKKSHRLALRRTHFGRRVRR